MKRIFLVIFYKMVSFFTKKKFIIDISGVILTPGNHGKNCKGNGYHKSKLGKTIECCCDECDYFLECYLKK